MGDAPPRDVFARLGFPDAPDKGAEAGAEPTEPSKHQQPPKAARWHISEATLEFLERYFEMDPFPKQENQNLLAQKFGVLPRQVQVWFQNRRQKWRAQRTQSGSKSDPALVPTKLWRHHSLEAPGGSSPTPSPPGSGSTPQMIIPTSASTAAAQPQGAPKSNGAPVSLNAIRQHSDPLASSTTSWNAGLNYPAFVGLPTQRLTPSAAGSRPGTLVLNVADYAMGMATVRAHVNNPYALDSCLPFLMSSQRHNVPVPAGAGQQQAPGGPVCVQAAPLGEAPAAYFSHWHTATPAGCGTLEPDQQKTPACVTADPRDSVELGGVQLLQCGELPLQQPPFTRMQPPWSAPPFHQRRHPSAPVAAATWDVPRGGPPVPVALGPEMPDFQRKEKKRAFEHVPAPSVRSSRNVMPPFLGPANQGQQRAAVLNLSQVQRRDVVDVEEPADSADLLYELNMFMSAVADHEGANPCATTADVSNRARLAGVAQPHHLPEKRKAPAR